MIEEARKWAEELANSEGEVFEQAMARIKPESDELQQAWRQGFVEGKKAHDKRIIEIARHYGYEAQREQFVEECSEAILAVQKVKRRCSNGNFINLAEEVADVLIMAEQMRILISQSLIDEFIQKKLERQIQRIKEEEV
jgi:NTP pyrophosphatase (non-canonical NTP hydrolase)